MSVRLIIRPDDEPMSWQEFLARTGPYAIALDGYVSEGPRFDENGPRINFNHHEGVDRLATRATCAQVLIAMRLGLFKRFRDADGPRGDVYVNDCDEDVCASWFLLSHPSLAEPASNPALNRLIGLVDAMDTTAGAYPFHPDLPGLQTLAWIFQPYRRFRVSGGLDRRKAGEFEGIITDVGHRMMEEIAGRGQRIPLDTRYARVGGGPGWTMIRENGENGRMGAFADGIGAYVVARDCGDGRTAYTVGRVSQFIPFDVPHILALLNEAEGSPDRRWGGGNTIGGSPRTGDSKLALAEVEKIINDALA